MCLTSSCPCVCLTAELEFLTALTSDHEIKKKVYSQNMIMMVHCIVYQYRIAVCAFAIKYMLIFKTQQLEYKNVDFLLFYILL